MLNWLTKRLEGEKPMSLKAAFALSRDSKNIDVILPALRASQLFVVVGELRPADSLPEFFLTPSPQRDRMCVTVSESRASLDRIQWLKQQISGGDLLTVLPAGIEIVIVYGDGGDYLTQGQLAWFRGGR